ncbi:hypothetical protein GDO86_014060, partial [Hymenochirus boettgeri]
TNQTEITEFILLGIEGPQTVNLFLYFVFLVLYILTTCGNLLIIVLFLKSQHLSFPLYFFLTNLSICDISLSTIVAPTLFSNLLRGRLSISVTDCFLQVYAYGSTLSAECNLLAVMSYDRYLAICNPLHYIRIMTPNLRANLVLFSWLSSFLYCFIAILEVLSLEFCGCNVINYIYCEIVPLLAISCKNTTILQLTTTAMSVPIILIPFLFILLTYVHIALTILKIPSVSGRKKAFSTCSSHLTVVCMFFGVLIAKYMVASNDQSLNLNKAISLLYTAVTPFLNPIVYSLRSKDIRTAAFKLFTGIK